MQAEVFLGVPQVVWTTATGALSGLLGGLVAYGLAFRRFRKERAFDRRAEWYERVLRALNELSLTLQGIMYAVERGNAEKVDELKKAAKDQEAALHPILSDREIYAKQRAYDALRAFIVEANNLSNLQAAVLQTQAALGGTPGAGNIEHFVPALLRATNTAAEALADEFRVDMFGSWRGRLRRRPRKRWLD